ncbi:MAG: CoA-binding protein [Alphaproteobacteria bacterium]|nr:CoA-binding protein [Alphaproteobacteria bacterium]
MAVDHDAYEDRYLRNILRTVRTIAMVGASPNWNRPSYFAMKYLQQKGYRVIPINPRAAGTEILGETVLADLEELDGPVDMVDIFRNSEAAGAIVEETLERPWKPKVIWMQLGVRHETAARKAEALGIDVVMDRCPKIEYSRLMGELGWHGINTGVISSKRRRA